MCEPEMLNNSYHGDHRGSSTNGFNGEIGSLQGRGCNWINPTGRREGGGGWPGVDGETQVGSDSGHDLFRNITIFHHSIGQGNKGLVVGIANTCKWPAGADIYRCSFDKEASVLGLALFHLLRTTLRLVLRAPPTDVNSIFITMARHNILSSSPRWHGQLEADILIRTWRQVN